MKDDDKKRGKGKRTRSLSDKRLRAAEVLRNTKILIVRLDVSAYSHGRLRALHAEIGKHLADKHPGVEVRCTLLDSSSATEVSYPDDAPTPPPSCPKCGNRHGLKLVETYEAHQDIDYDDEAQIPVVISVWNNTEMFSDGNSDYEARCEGCGHRSTDLATFGLADGGWDWR